MNSTSVASGLHPNERQQLAVKILSKQDSVSHLANQEQVSRKFLYQQKRIAKSALNKAFEKVLDQKLVDIAHKFQISLSKVRQVCLLMKKSLSKDVYWQRWNQVYQLLKGKFLPVKKAVESAMKSTQAS